MLTEINIFNRTFVCKSIDRDIKDTIKKIERYVNASGEGVTFQYLESSLHTIFLKYKDFLQYIPEVRVIHEDDMLALYLINPNTGEPAKGPEEIIKEDFNA